MTTATVKLIRIVPGLYRTTDNKWRVRQGARSGKPASWHVEFNGVWHSSHDTLQFAREVISRHAYSGR